MKHYTLVKAGVLSVLSLGLSVPGAYALGTIIPESPARGLYGAASAGVGHNSDLKQSWDDGSIVSRHTDETAPIYKLALGYQINPYVSVEGAYHDLGKYTMNGISDGSGDSWSAGFVTGEQEADGWSMSVSGRWPISQRWTLVGTFGWLWWDSTEKYNENGFQSSHHETGDDFMFSGGVEFDHGHKDRIVYTAEVGHQSVGDDDMDIITGFAGVLYRFP